MEGRLPQRSELNVPSPETRWYGNQKLNIVSISQRIIWIFANNTADPLPSVRVMKTPSINSIHQGSVDATLIEVIRKAVREELQAVIEQNGKRGGFRMDPATDKSPDFKPYLTIKEAADLARLAPPTIRLYIRKGGLRAHKVGRRVIIKREELIAFLEQRQVKGAAN